MSNHLNWKKTLYNKNMKDSDPFVPTRLNRQKHVAFIQSGNVV